MIWDGNVCLRLGKAIQNRTSVVLPDSGGGSSDVPRFLNPDNGLYYEWRPRVGDNDPVTGLPTIVGEWVAV